MDPSPPTVGIPSTETKHSHLLTYILFLITGIVLGSIATWGYQKFFFVPVDVLQPSPLPMVTATPSPTLESSIFNLLPLLNFNTPS